MNRIIKKIICKSREKSEAFLPSVKIEKVTDEDLFKYTKRVSIELSNLCNYAIIHKKCPLNKIEGPVILPTKIVSDVLDTLKRYKFGGTIAFHTYNEPLMDPRLFKFIELAKSACPSPEIYLCTNGYYLDQTMANELVEIGVSKIRISAYTNNELNRLEKIRVNVPFIVEKTTLDNRLNLYESPENRFKEPCFAPLNEIIIGREGCLSLCCLDWRRQYSFGNLHEQTFEQVIRSGELHAIYKRLSKGDRYIDLCKRCGWIR